MYCDQIMLERSVQLCPHVTGQKILIDASKEVGLELNVEKTKYMLVSRDQNAGQNWGIKIGNRSFENVSVVQVFGNDSNK
jgi:hypothetical protein